MLIVVNVGYPGLTNSFCCYS